VVGRLEDFMKPIQFILSVSSAVVVLFLGYHFFLATSFEERLGSIDGKVGEQGIELDRISKEARESQDHLVKHDGAITVLEKRVGVLEGEMKETGDKIQKSEAEVHALKESALKDHEKIARVETELASLKEENAQRGEELRVLKKEIDRRQEEVERRLRLLEKKAGLEPPVP
jgi:peptidoglycan hydrolase CwlO-like protein